MRFRDGPVAISALIALSVWMFAILPFYYGPHAGQIAQAQQNSEQKSGPDRKEWQSLWVPTDSVGLYTLVLAVFTGLLVAVSGFQGYMLIQADKTARISAEAARLSAIATASGLLPVIHVDGIKSDGWRSLPFPDDPNGMGIEISTIFVNNGNGNASVVAMTTGAYLGEELDRSLLPDRPWKLKDGLFITSRGNLRMEEAQPIWISRQDFDRLLTDKANFWYVGTIRFKDFLGDETELGFIWQWDASRFREAYTAEHTYYKKIEKRA